MPLQAETMNLRKQERIVIFVVAPNVLLIQEWPHSREVSFRYPVPRDVPRQARHFHHTAVGKQVVEVVAFPGLSVRDGFLLVVPKESGERHLALAFPGLAQELKRATCAIVIDEERVLDLAEAVLCDAHGITVSRKSSGRDSFHVGLQTWK